MTSFEEVKRVLESRRLCSKAVRVSESSECLLVACRRGETVILVAFSEYEDWTYAKAVPGEGVPAATWACSSVYYTPYGIYAFGKNLEEVVEKLAEKMRVVEAQGRVVEQKLAAGAQEA